jgi:hypothetical protein
LFFLGALSERFLLLLLTMLLGALANLLSSLAPLLFQVIETLLLYSTLPLIPTSIRLFFLSFEATTLLFLSTRFFLKTDLLSFSSEPFFFVFTLLFKTLLLVQMLLFLLFLQLPPALLLKCLPVLPLRLPLGSLSTLTLCLPLLLSCSILAFEGLVSELFCKMTVFFCINCLLALTSLFG